MEIQEDSLDMPVVCEHHLCGFSDGVCVWRQSRRSNTQICGFHELPYGNEDLLNWQSLCHTPCICAASCYHVKWKHVSSTLCPEEIVQNNMDSTTAQFGIERKAGGGMTFLRVLVLMIIHQYCSHSWGWMDSWTLPSAVEFVIKGADGTRCCSFLYLMVERERGNWNKKFIGYILFQAIVKSAWDIVVVVQNHSYIT